VCERLTVPPAEAYGVATFYAMFSVEPRPATVVHVCDDIVCRSEIGEITEGLERVLGAEGAGQGDRTWIRSPCLGMCDRAPAALIQRTGDEDVVVAPAIGDAIPGLVSGRSPQSSEFAPVAEAVPGTERRLLRRVGVVDPTSLDDYRAHGGFEALRTALDLGPEATIREVSDSKLLGRGGAAFPTGVKWDAVAKQGVRPHYFVCNADESEPGTFKDRVLMEGDPFAVIEALTIAGFATGAELGYIYVRAEYPVATARLRRAIDQARRHGLLGDDVMGRGLRFDVELRRGAGAYICGEETALFNSIEGKRGEPRNKPPFPVHKGLFGRPTGINNVETLVNVLEILRIGGRAYAQIGTEGSTGPRLLCLSGSVRRPGVYEAEHGIALGEALEAAGGAVGNLKAVLLGGAAGGFVGPQSLDVKLTFEDARAGGYTLGSGVVMAFDDSIDLVDVCLRIARFFRDESCGQCVPCRVGTVRQEEALLRLASDRAMGSRLDELELLGEIAQVMRDASICGLGQTAANAIQSAIVGLGVFGEKETAV
jgi:NADH-quinone oxidoreductase subunit F